MPPPQLGENSLSSSGGEGRGEEVCSIAYNTIFKARQKKPLSPASPRKRGEGSAWRSLVVVARCTLIKVGHSGSQRRLSSPAG
jgi:hypothetical protein